MNQDKLQVSIRDIIDLIEECNGMPAPYFDGDHDIMGIDALKRVTIDKLKAEPSALHAYLIELIELGIVDTLEDYLSDPDAFEDGLD